MSTLRNEYDLSLKTMYHYNIIPLSEIIIQKCY